MDCPDGCEKQKHPYNQNDKTLVPIKLNKFENWVLSRSGKTLLFFYQCPKCKTIFRKGKRIKRIVGDKKQ